MEEEEPRDQPRTPGPSRPGRGRGRGRPRSTATSSTKKRSAESRRGKYTEDKVKVQIWMKKSDSENFEEVKKEINVSSNAAALEYLIDL